MKKINIFRKQRGVIKIHRKFFDDDVNEKSIKSLYENFFPFFIGMENNFGSFEYVELHGYSPLFRVIEEGELSPTYMPWFKEAKGGIIFDKFEEYKEEDPTQEDIKINMVRIEVSTDTMLSEIEMEYVTTTTEEVK